MTLKSEFFRNANFGLHMEDATSATGVEGEEFIQLPRTKEEAAIDTLLALDDSADLAEAGVWRIDSKFPHASNNEPPWDSPELLRRGRPVQAAGSLISAFGTPTTAPTRATHEEALNKLHRKLENEGASRRLQQWQEERARKRQLSVLPRGVRDALNAAAAVSAREAKLADAQPLVPADVVPATPSGATTGPTGSSSTDAAKDSSMNIATLPEISSPTKSAKDESMPSCDGGTSLTLPAIDASLLLSASGSKRHANGKEECHQPGHQPGRSISHLQPSRVRTGVRPAQAGSDASEATDVGAGEVTPVLTRLGPGAELAEQFALGRSSIELSMPTNSEATSQCDGSLRGQRVAGRSARGTAGAKGESKGG
eukprot:CAMPEP_0119335756 /NCGR_PEP_ID=MMETSP1333-20130426/90294_1 /TAXON_ID=418940 /ORGANISM="Scyphosphaera apsteinii, Strain RCC1455" /LENGTH=368 /DNA_ID=CAMNT_0007346399 /DNA_START=122 /DNA_END=1225 /DNA_ORIENTATION=-